MGNGNPVSGHTNHNLTVATATNVDGLGDGDHILSPTLTNMVEGIHGNGVIMYDDTSGGEGSRNKPHELPGAVNYTSPTTFTVQGGYAVLDGIMYQFAGGVGATTTYTLNTSSASAAGSPTALTSGKEALVVVYVSADNTSTVKNVYWELGTATPAGTNSYPATPTSFLNIPIATGTASENYLSNTQTVVLAVLRVVYDAGGDDLKLSITEVNDKRVFVRPSPLYFSPVTSGDVASTDELLDLDAFHSGIGNGALGASRFGAMWQSFGAAVTGATVPDDNKDTLYYSGTHAARYTRSVFDRVLTSTATSITLKSTDANILLLTPSGNASVTTSGSFPAGYIIEVRNLHATRTVTFVRSSSYTVNGGTLTRFICTTSHADTPVFSVLSDDSIETVQIADNAVTTAKIVDSNVTLAKIANIANDRVLGNISGSAATPTELTAANLRTLLGVADGSLTTNDFTDADHSKLNAIEASATADQTDAEIRAAVEAATDSNVFTDADHSKLNGIEASADVTDTANVVAALTAGTNVAIAGDGTISATDTNTTYTVGDGGLTQKNFTTTLKNKLDGIEASATADQTDAEIRAAVEAATDSNVFTDADHSKLNAIEASADVTDATNVNAAGAVMESDVDAKGDIFVATANNTLTRLAVGTDTHVLTADSAEASGVKWAAASGGGGGTAPAIEDNSGTPVFASGITKAEVHTLLNIEDNADVTDTANVTAAGALMDSEVANLAQVKAFNSADYATAAQGVLAAAAVPAGQGGAEPYNPANPGNWVAGPPPDLETAIQRLTAQLVTLAGPIPP